MLQFFSRLFNVRPGEWPRLLIIYVLGMLFLIGVTWGETISYGKFLEQVGAGYLAFTFIGDALLTILAIAVYTAFVDHIANDRVLIGLLIISALAVIIGRVLIATRYSFIAFPLLYVLSHVIRDTFVVHWWTYIGGFYDTQAAKRVMPLIATGARPAGIIAGFSTPLLNRFLQPADIILLWAVVLGVMALGVALIPRLLRETRTGPGYTPSTSGATSYSRNVREGARFVSQSSFLRWMAFSTFLMIVLFALMNYQTGQILKAQLGSSDAISNFTGNLTGITNLIMLPIQLFILSRLVSRLGLGNANLIFPISTLGIVGALIALPSTLVMAALSDFDRTTYRTAFRNTIDTLLYNAVPLRVKGRARAFIGGLVVPIGSLISGGLLIVLPTLTGTPWLLPMLLGVFAIGYTLTTFVIRREYTRALITMLEQEDFSFLLDAAADLRVSDSATLNYLKNKMAEAQSNEAKIFMAKLLSEVGGDETVPVLIETARAGDPQVRAAIIDTLVAADARGPEVRKLLADLLNDPESVVRQAAIAGLKQWANPNSEQFLALALDLSRDPSPDVRIQVLPPLIRSGDMFYVTGAVQALTPILSDPDPRWRARGVQVLGQANDVRFIQNMLFYLSDPDDEVRLEAATAIETLSQSALPKYLTELLHEGIGKLLNDPIERVRQAAITILGRMNTPETQNTLITFLTDPSQEIRDAAANALTRIGKPIVPVLSAKLNSDDLQLRKMVTVVLSRIDRERSNELIRTYIQGNLLSIYKNQVRLGALTDCAGYRSVGILQSVLRERNAQLLSEIFYMLAAVHDQKTIRVLADSLNSEAQRTRANAIEALESISTPQIAKLMGPLFDRDMPPEKLFAYSREVSGIRSDTAEIMRQLATDPADSWLRAIMSFAFGEIGISAYETALAKTQGLNTSEPPKTDSTADDKSKVRRSRSTVDLFGAITGDIEVPQGGKDKVFDRLDRATNTITPGTPAAPALSLSACQSLFTRDQLEAMLRRAAADPVPEVQLAARAATRMLGGLSLSEMFQVKGEIMLSAIEKIIFLKEVSFFGGMTVDQLKILASVCEEEVFNEEAVIFNEGEVGGALYVVVRGRVGLEREGGARKGSTLRIGTVQAYSYFGEMTLFDNSPRTEKAVAIQDTLTLRLRREPVIALTRQYPDLSLKLINVLSQRLREANDRIAQLTTAKPRELHKVFDKLG